MLTKSDLEAIREIVREEVRAMFKPMVTPEKSPDFRSFAVTSPPVHPQNEPGRRPSTPVCLPMLTVDDIGERISVNLECGPQSAGFAGTLNAVDFGADGKQRPTLRITDCEQSPVKPMA